MGAFQNTKLTNVEIPNNVELIGTSAFLNTPIENLKLGQGLKEIQEGAFWSAKLKSLEIPDSVKIIGKNSFYESNLESIILSKNIEVIGDSAFTSAKLTEKLSKSDYPNLTTIGINNPIFK